MIFNEIDNIINTSDNLSITEIYDNLSRLNIYDKIVIDFYMYDKYKYIYHHQTVIDNRDGQEEFRKKLINRYGCCIISGSPPITCEAAHIIPYANLTIDKYNIDNGLLIRADLHKLFDNKQLIIDPITLKISIDSTIEYYTDFNNKIININENSIKYLKEYYKIN
jgi:hypothetical protein